MRNNRSPLGCAHIVLIPGFAGFDVLGQLEYYAGVTPLFGRWEQSAASRRRVALHYFDNFPTAAVSTRAARLRNYLAKRIARGEFAAGDSVALVGHSTGGLDVRKLLWELNESREKRYPVDGVLTAGAGVPAEEILQCINRIVFLSVPQYGTNIADWVRSYKLGRQLIVADLRLSVGASQFPVLDKLQELLANYTSVTMNLGLVFAIRDALSEAEMDGSREPMAMALAQEAAAELELWLRHIASDFHAIDDLAAGNVASDPESPAHFNKETRDKERERWASDNIKTRSYATLGARPFSFSENQPAKRWDLLKPATYPELTPQTPAATDTDIVYRACYRACAGGPFSCPPARELPAPRPFAVAENSKPELSCWDNDGIVNTASMLWPNYEKTLLVNADHMDIVGHYKLVPTVCGDARRKYQAYDLLKSASGFHDASFRRVWNDIFDFCTS